MSSTALAHTQPTAMDLLHMAVQNGLQVDTIERLAALQRQMAETAAETAFNQAMHAAQGQMRRIGADAQNPQTRSKYLTYTKLDAALRPIYTNAGFSVSFNTEPAPENMLRVIAYVSHQDGHTRKYQIDMPADGKGAKGNDVMTRTHATGAAASYGMRYLLKMIFNVAVGETDDDGNAASKASVGESQLADYMDAISAAADLDELRRVFEPAYRYAQGMGDSAAMKMLATAKDKRKAAL